MERYEVIRTLWKNEQIKHLNIVVSEYKDVKKIIIVIQLTKFRSFCFIRYKAYKYKRLKNKSCKSNEL